VTLRSVGREIHLDTLRGNLEQLHLQTFYRVLHMEMNKVTSSNLHNPLSLMRLFFTGEVNDETTYLTRRKEAIVIGEHGREPQLHAVCLTEVQTGKCGTHE
jgi:hypothetical protein